MNQYDKLMIMIKAENLALARLQNDIASQYGGATYTMIRDLPEYKKLSDFLDSLGAEPVKLKCVGNIVNGLPDCENCGKHGLDCAGSEEYEN